MSKEYMEISRETVQEIIDLLGKAREYCHESKTWFRYASMLIPQQKRKRWPNVSFSVYRLDNESYDLIDRLEYALRQRECMDTMVEQGKARR